MEAPLSDLLESIERLSRLDIERELGGHRDEIEGPRSVMDAYVEHHVERSGRILGIVGGTPHSCYEIAAGLFGGFQDRKDLVFRMMETQAHRANPLRRENIRKRVSGRGVVESTLVRFGGGVASTSRTCGALLGGVALISSLYSRGDLEEERDQRMWRPTFKLVKKFEEIGKEYGGIECRDIAMVGWSNKEAAREFHTNPESRRTICAKIVGDTAFALGWYSIRNRFLVSRIWFDEKGPT